MTLTLLFLVYILLGLCLLAALVVINDRVEDPTLRCPGKSLVSFAQSYKETLWNFVGKWLCKSFSLSEVIIATIIFILWPVISFFWIFQLLVDRYINDYHKWVKLNEIDYLAIGPDRYYLYNKWTKALRGIIATEAKIKILNEYYYRPMLPKRFKVLGLFEDAAFKPDINRTSFDWYMDALQLPELFEPKDRVHLVHIMRKHRVPMSGTRATYADWASQAFKMYPYKHHYARVLSKFIHGYHKYLDNL